MNTLLLQEMWHTAEATRQAAQDTAARSQAIRAGSAQRRRVSVSQEQLRQKAAEDRRPRPACFY